MSFWDHKLDDVHDVNYKETKVINAERKHRLPSTRFSTRSSTGSFIKQEEFTTV